MKFSLLMANYNNGKYFSDCYSSIIKQTFQNWEVIIVDDCSTDNSIATIQSIIKDDHRFKLYKNDKNKGVGFTKKRCADLAEGDILGFLDPDDTISPNAIEVSVYEFEKNQNLVCTYSKVNICNHKLKFIKNFSGLGEVINNRFFFNYPIQISHFFTFRKETYHYTEGINANRRISVDQDLYLKILEMGDIKFINEALYNYRTHSGGISQFKSKNKSKKAFAEIIHETMKRRYITDINGIAVPDKFTSTGEIFKMLNYQNSFYFRLKKKIKIWNTKEHKRTQ